MPTDVYLYDAVRTPFGKYGGALAGVPPPPLAAHPPAPPPLASPTPPPLNDGAARARLGSPAAEQLTGMPPLARIAGRGAAANDPRYFGFAPVEAANAALKRAGIGWGDVDEVELNEAFAAQTVACINAWGVDPGIVNAHGGASAIHHPPPPSGPLPPA